MSVAPYQTIPFQLTQPPLPMVPKQADSASVLKFMSDVVNYLQVQQRMMASTVYPDIQNSLGGVSLTGPAASLPAAGVAGRFYFATDTLTLYRDTGSVWHSVVMT